MPIIQFCGGKNTDVPVVPMKDIQQHQITTKGGNILELFYNPENNLVVIDLIANNEMGGRELLRRTLNEEKLLAHTKIKHND